MDIEHLPTGELRVTESDGLTYRVKAENAERFLSSCAPVPALRAVIRYVCEMCNDPMCDWAYDALVYFNGMWQAREHVREGNFELVTKEVRDRLSELHDLLLSVHDEANLQGPALYFEGDVPPNNDGKQNR